MKELNFKGGKMLFVRKLTSRKFWVTIIYIVLTVLKATGTLEFSDMDLLTLAGVLASYVVGESFTDGKRYQNGG